MTPGLLALQFLLRAALIGVAGYWICQIADRIARATGLTGGWIGLALLATVTSRPELAMDISAVTVMDAPNLAVGNALGACVFNLVFLVVIDALQRRQPIYRHASAAHLLSAAFGVVMLGFVAMSLLLPGTTPAMLHLGLYSPVLLALCLLALRSVFAHEQSLRCVQPAATAPASAEAMAQPAPGLRPEWTRFGLAALDDGLEPELCRHALHGLRHHAARNRGHAVGLAPARARHGDGQPAGQQPVQRGDTGHR